MKSLLIILMMFSLTQVKATTEHLDADNDRPTTEEIKKNRACFEEVSQNGCGDPGEDMKHFRTCLHNVFPTLTQDCRKMMSKLYHRKD